MRRASVPLRLERLTGVRASGNLERTVAELASEYGLHPAEVRAELEVVAERIRRFGPGTPAQTIRQCAEEFGLPEEELWTEYARITGTVGVRR